MEDHKPIKLDKVGEPEANSLPRGVRAILVNGDIIFVRRSIGRFVPLPTEEQDRLREKHVL